MTGPRYASRLAVAVAAWIWLVGSPPSLAQTPQANLSVTNITTTPASPQTGATFTYTVTVSNGGSSTATGVVVTNVLPPGVGVPQAGPGG
jgi:uncharacterized repeat protein (TIGR01451 family)